MISRHINAHAQCNWFLLFIYLFLFLVLNTFSCLCGTISLCLCFCFFILFYFILAVFIIVVQHPAKWNAFEREPQNMELNIIYNTQGGGWTLQCDWNWFASIVEFNSFLTYVTSKRNGYCSIAVLFAECLMLFCNLSLWTLAVPRVSSTYYLLLLRLLM